MKLELKDSKYFLSANLYHNSITLSVIKKTSNFREAVKVVSVPLVAPGDDQVLIKNIYAGVNATDVNITAARYNPNAELPFDVGLEGLGVIEAVGKNVTTHKVGQNVITFGVNPPRAYSEYLVICKPRRSDTNSES
ncbi:unnamed protein product [Oppiella nova]|uniref:Alcohol dehydrogenase-like N-terminal domain-containing protein n=1 Tax=Oppiella nova TaxID=334625 RepID=A0A7R9MKP2_9ACAR|nr:unnamed protein product [Oppiella nova]CAG2178185.1 unnamed protein product [Oppiella nova]